MRFVYWHLVDQNWIVLLPVLYCSRRICQDQRELSCFLKEVQPPVWGNPRFPFSRQLAETKASAHGTEKCFELALFISVSRRLPLSVPAPCLEHAPPWPYPRNGLLPGPAGIAVSLEMFQLCDRCVMGQAEGRWTPPHTVLAPPPRPPPPHTFHGEHRETWKHRWTWRPWKRRKMKPLHKRFI